MSAALEQLQAAFRQAATELEDEPDGPIVARACLVLHRVTGHRRWIDRALAAIEVGGGPDRVEAAAEAWVARASADLRRIRTWAEDLPIELRSATALLAAWRVTGEDRLRDRGLQAAEQDGALADRIRALRAAWRATGGERPTAPATDFAGVDLLAWSALADLLDLTGEALHAAALRALGGGSPAGRVLALAALCLPVLQVRVDWWLPEELREGPMAEAATFSYPALRLRFGRLPHRDQIRFTATLGGVEHPTLEDAGVVQPWLESLMEDVDRGPLVGESRRRRRSRLRG